MKQSEFVHMRRHKTYFERELEVNHPLMLLVGIRGWFIFKKSCQKTSDVLYCHVSGRVVPSLLAGDYEAVSGLSSCKPSTHALGSAAALVAPNHRRRVTLQLGIYCVRLVSGTLALKRRERRISVKGGFVFWLM
jgi:hypothetical protein